MQRDLYSEDHTAFQEVVREFVARAVAPNVTRWEEERGIDREAWLEAGRQGIIGLAIPEKFGGGGENDFRYRNIVIEELARVGAAALHAGFSVNEDVVTPYLLDLATTEQSERWLPGVASGELITAIALTEPSTGSDLRAIRTSARRVGDEWIINGQKTFISSGMSADLILVGARTGLNAGLPELSLFLVERARHGFSNGRQLSKVGMHAQDTAEMFFDDVRVPITNLLGQEGRGFAYLKERLPRERMGIAAYGQAAAEAALAGTLRYTRERTAFGTRISDFQHTRFVLAEIATEIDVSRAYFDRAIMELNAGRLSAVDAAKTKWWCTDLQVRVVDRCLQLHGGSGYMIESPIARAYVDARAQTIYGGTNEIMKEIIGRDLTR